MYKIIAKILTNRLKKVIEVNIGRSQSAFIEWRSIIDNILFSHELFKVYNNKGIYHICVLKVDIRKWWCLTKPFQAKRGIRQGNSMSPYLFVIAMEYLQREMNQLPMIKEFKDDKSSLIILQKTFQKFSAASGLQANADKSSIYIGGVHKDLKDTLISLLGYTKGSLPFKYLGVPLSTKKLNIQQCLPLVEKITERTQIFLLPKRITKLIETICSTYLWTGTSATFRKALIACEKVCQPKAVGGLNIINMGLWNKAAFLKQLWALAKKRDSLWIKWAHYYYIKQRDLDTMTTPKAVAWVVRQIIDSKQVLMQMNTMQGNLNAKLTMLETKGRFQIKRAYTQLLPQLPKVTWKSIHMHPQIHPRFKFHLWLAIHQRLSTVERLQKFGIQVPFNCVFCALNIKIFSHLFFECSSTSMLWIRMLKWLGHHRRTDG
ncbi:uncharacterized protein [Nicotiana tomentosiformis]|uniref:uncharacterized protein n=1 Tax=Nicotiana tomentosiformis TaxID=4098 RepID=UPI00388CE5B9